MNWQNFIRGLVLSTLIFGGLLLFLTIFTSPERGSMTIMIYYISLFFFVLGLSAITGFYLRKWWMHNEVLYSSVKISLRQGVIAGLFAISVLALGAMRLLVWWDALILAISFLLIELYFKTRN